MFQWFTRLFSGNSFRPPAAEIYRYHDGRTSVRGDPMAILRRLAMDDAFDLNREIKLSAVPGTVGFQAYDRLMSGIRAAFELPSVRDGGLTDIQCSALLLDFQGWVEKKSASMPPLPVSVVATPDSPAEPSPEPSNSDCSSTNPEPSPDNLSPSSQPSTL